MAFEALDKQAMPGYYNSTESSWGGFPVKGDDGSYYLVHAQMANHCDLYSWTENSIVGLTDPPMGKLRAWTSPSLWPPPLPAHTAFKSAAAGPARPFPRCLPRLHLP